MKNIDPEKLKEAVHRECERRGWSWKTLASEIHVHKRQLDRALAGTSVNTLRRVAHRLDLSFEQLTAQCFLQSASQDARTMAPPPHDPLLHALKRVCSKQLRKFEMRDSQKLGSTAARLAEIYTQGRHHCNADPFFRTIAAGFPGHDRPLLDRQEQADAALLRSFCDQRARPLAVSTCTWFVATLAVLAYMRRRFDIPMQFDFDFAHSGVTAIHLKQAVKPLPPDISIVADGPSVYIFNHFAREPIYVPMAFAPPLEHRVVLHREASLRKDGRWSLEGEYYVVNPEQLISTPKLHLEALIRAHRIRQNRITLKHTDPGTQIPIFESGAAETRSIFCDPMWDVIQLWNPQSFIVHATLSMWSDVLLHFEREFSSESASEAMLRLFYGTIHELKYDFAGSAVEAAVETLLDSNDYRKLLLHYCGLK